MAEMRPEWKDARNHREPRWPLLGYAPGKYIGRCIKCDGRFLDMDKRAYHCLPCAIDAAVEHMHRTDEDIRVAKKELQTLADAFQIVQRAKPAETEAAR